MPPGYEPKNHGQISTNTSGYRGVTKTKSGYHTACNREVQHTLTTQLILMQFVSSHLASLTSKEPCWKTIETIVRSPHNHILTALATIQKISVIITKDQQTSKDKTTLLQNEQRDAAAFLSYLSNKTVTSTTAPSPTPWVLGLLSQLDNLSIPKYIQSLGLVCESCRAANGSSKPTTLSTRPHHYQHQHQHTHHHHHHTPTSSWYVARSTCTTRNKHRIVLTNVALGMGNEKGSRGRREVNVAGQNRDWLTQHTFQRRPPALQPSTNQTKRLLSWT